MDDSIHKQAQASDNWNPHNKIGYLAPDGNLFECEAWGHMDKAKEVCLALYGEDFYSGVKAEEYLLSKGFVILYARSVGFWKFNVDRLKTLSPQQKYFLMDEEKLCEIDEKVQSIKDILEHNDCVNRWRNEATPEKNED